MCFHQLSYRNTDQPSEMFNTIQAHIKLMFTKLKFKKSFSYPKMAHLADLADKSFLPHCINIPQTNIQKLIIPYFLSKSHHSLFTQNLVPYFFYSTSQLPLPKVSLLKTSTQNCEDDTHSGKQLLLYSYTLFFKFPLSDDGWSGADSQSCTMDHISIVTQKLWCQENYKQQILKTTIKTVSRAHFKYSMYLIQRVRIVTSSLTFRGDDSQPGFSKYKELPLPR